MAAGSLTVDLDGSSDELRSPPRPIPPRRRKFRERISLGHLFMIASALLAFVLVVSLLQDRTVTTTVVVAERDIQPGTVITPSMVSEVELPADSDLLGAVATLDTIAAGDVSAGQRIRAGDPITVTAIAPASSTSALRAMSIPIDRVDAVGGDLGPGDRVDVISVDTGTATYVAVDLEVLDTQAADANRGALGSATSTTYYVTVSVDAQTGLAIALALEEGRVSVLRSTGADAVDSDRRELRGANARPVATDAADDDEDGEATGG